ncbi:MAG TPA: hypothetical protein PL169_11430, partial [Leptospiraceae bacterium]|nr:hypothetical protein [Leptospiraceae bacterium]
MKTKTLTVILIIITSLNLSCSDQRKAALSRILPFLLALFKTSSPASAVPASGGTSVTEPNPDDTAFVSNSGSDPNDPTNFGGGTLGGPPPPPVGPADPPPIGTGGPIIDTSGTVTGTVIKTTDVVDRYQDIVIEFSESMDRATVCNGETGGALTLKINGGAVIPASDMSCRWSTDRQLLIRHYKSFLPYTKYDIIISNAAKPSYDSASRSFTNFTNAADAVNNVGGNTFSFRTESAFNPTSVTLNFNGTNYNYDGTKGMNLDSYGILSPANEVKLSYSTADFSRAEIITLKKVGTDPSIGYVICNTGCVNNLSLLNLNTALPAALQTSNGMNAYYLELQVRVTTVPLQYKRYYRTVNFNWGNHLQVTTSSPAPVLPALPVSYGPEQKIPMVGMLVLDKGPSGGSSEGTIDVLGHFIELYAGKFFTLNSDYASPGTPVNESLNQMLRRNASTDLPYAQCTDVNSLTKSACMDWSHYGDKNTFTQVNPYGLFTVLEGYAKRLDNGLPYSFPVGGPYPTAKSPFPYLTQIGPFKGLSGVDRTYPIPNLTPLLSSTISAGVDQIITNALNGIIPQIVLDFMSDFVSQLIGAVLGGILGGIVAAVNGIAPLQLLYDFNADAYVRQAVFGKKNPPAFSSGAPWYNYAPDTSQEADLLRAVIDVVPNSPSGPTPKLEIKVKAKEINAELMANLKVTNVDLQFYFIKLIPFDPIYVNISSDPLDWFNELCPAGVCTGLPDLLSPKNWFDISGPGPIDIWFNMAWNRVEMSWLTSILHGYYIARVFAEMNPTRTEPAHPFLPANNLEYESIYRIVRVYASADSGLAAELKLNVNNTNDGAVPPRIKDIIGTEWSDYLIAVPGLGGVGSGLLINPLMMAAS